MQQPSTTLSIATMTVTILIVTVLVNHSAAASSDSFVYSGCSQAKFTPGTQYENNVDSLLTSVVNSATYSFFNKFTASSGGGPAVYGLFQCRPDLSNADCARCVARSVSQLGVLCANSAGAAIQLDGCFVRYDGAAFLGVEDKSLVAKKCGPQLGYADSDELTRRDSVLGYLAGGAQMFRVGGSGRVQGVAECVGDISADACRDCLGEAIRRLKGECGVAAWGDVYLAKCYARYSVGGAHAYGNNGSSSDDETEKTLAILIGLIAVVALAVIFLAFLRKLCDGKDGK